MERGLGLLRDLLVAVASVLVLAGVITDDQGQRYTAAAVLLIATGSAFAAWAYNEYKSRPHQ
jgi:hypothetical protein